MTTPFILQESLKIHNVYFTETFGFVFIHNVLAYCDVDHLISALARRKVSLENAVGVDRKELELRQIKSFYSPVIEIFNRNNAGTNLEIITTGNVNETSG